jgi:cysteinyl-tRNA synthetase
MEVTVATLDAATRALSALDNFARRTADIPSVAPDPTAVAAFRTRMDDDLDTPGVIADVADLRRRVNGLLDAGDAAGAAPLAAAVTEITSVVGLGQVLGSPQLSGIGTLVATAIVERDRARADRDFATADRIRASLEAEGWVVEDTPGGTRVHR